MNWQNCYEKNLEEGMSEKKAAFIADRQVARVQGKQEKAIKIRMDSDLPVNLVDYVKSLRSGIYPVKEYTEFYALVVMEKYIFENGYAIRKKVDHLDQVTIFVR